MNPYYYVLDSFTEEDMTTVRNMFYTKLYPIHRANAIISKHKSETKNSQVITYFKFPEIKLNDEEQRLISRYPILGKDCVINESGLLGGTIPHIDSDPYSGNRMSAINFPISGGNELSPTIFFGHQDDYENYYKESMHTIYIKEGITPIEKDRVYITDKPVLLNVKCWHTVKNFNPQPRLVFSWSCANGITYQDAYNFLSK
jgi:hypothetical protein